MNLIKKLGWSAINSIISSGIVLLQLSVTTKYLAASDFALFAIVTIFIGFCLQLAEGGIGNALVTFTDLDENDIGQVFSLAFIVSLCLMLILIFIAFPVSFFYENENLIYLLFVAALSIPLFTLARCYKSLVQKEINMKLIAIVEILARVLSFIFVIGLAIKGLGVWSLVCGTLIFSSMLFIFYFKLTRRVGYVFPNFRNKKLKKVLHFSLVQSGDLLLNYFTRNLDVLILVKIVGEDITGAYSVIKTFLMQISDTLFLSLNRLYYPHLSNCKNDILRLRIEYLKFFSLFNTLNYGALLVFIFFHHYLIPIFFKKEFLTLVPIILITLWLLCRYMSATVSTLWLVREKPFTGVVWSLINLTGVLIVLFTFEAKIYEIMVGFIFLSIVMLLLAYFLSVKLLSYDTFYGERLLILVTSIQLLLVTSIYYFFVS